MESAGGSSPSLPSSVDNPLKRTHSADEALAAPNQIPWSSQTSEKPTSSPPRKPITRRRFLVTLDQVKEAAKQLLKPDLKLPAFSDPSALVQAPIKPPNTVEALPENGGRSITSDSPAKKKTPPVEMPYGPYDDIASYRYRPKELRGSREEREAIARRRMILRLPELFDNIHYIYEVNKRSVFPKKEFMSRRHMFDHLGIQIEFVDDYLKLLHELAPEWIYEKTSSRGVHLLCVNNKIPGLESVRRRLSEAT